MKILISTKVRIVVLFMFLSFLSACGTTRISDSWQNENFSKKDFDNILVVAVTTNKTNRLLFENEFVRVFASEGIAAKPSWQAIGDDSPTKESVGGYLTKKEVDYILVTKVGDIKIDKDYVPPSSVTYYTGPYYPTYGSYWGAGSTVTMTREAYVDTRTTVVLVTSIYDAKTEELLWVGRSETFEVGSISHAAGELAGKALAHINN